MKIVGNVFDQIWGRQTWKYNVFQSKLLAGENPGLWNP
jgi:hypothetical protein